MVATLIIIRGNSASGKSTIAKQLQAELGEDTLLLSQDYLRREMLGTKDGENTTTIPLLTNLLNYGYHNCSYIILEGILRSDWYTPVWKHILKHNPNNTYAYYYDLSFQETVKRHSTRLKSLEFGEDSLARWWLEKDFLKEIPEKILTKSMSLEDVKKLIMTDVLP